jgi:hypothetical protein
VKSGLIAVGLMINAKRKLCKIEFILVRKLTTIVLLTQLMRAAFIRIIMIFVLGSIMSASLLRNVRK